MADLGSLLALQLQGARPEALSTAGLVEYVGDRSEAVRILSGMDARPRKADYGDAEAYKAALRSWTNAQRSVQRATAEEGRQRRGRTGIRVLSPEQAAQAFRLGIRRRLAAFRANGARVRMKAVVATESPTPTGVANVTTRLKTMPVGRTPAVLIGKTAMRHVLAGDPFSQVVERFEEEWWKEYPISGSWIMDVHWLKMWPEGWPEPPDSARSGERE